MANPIRTRWSHAGPGNGVAPAKVVPPNQRLLSFCASPVRWNHCAR